MRRDGRIATLRKDVERLRVTLEKVRALLRVCPCPPSRGAKVPAGAAARAGAGKIFIKARR